MLISSAVIAIAAIMIAGSVIYFVYTQPSNIVINSNDWQVYNNDEYNFTFGCPKEFETKTNNEPISFESQFFAGRSGINIVYVYVPQSYLPGTNFGDAIFSVDTNQQSLNQDQCLRIEYLQKSGVQKQINGVIFEEFTGTGAAAGNIYQTIAYRIFKNQRCYSLSIVIHSGNFQNYDPALGIKEFDYDKIYTILTQILETFTFIKM